MSNRSSFGKVAAKKCCYSTSYKIDSESNEDRSEASEDPHHCG